MTLKQLNLVTVFFLRAWILAIFRHFWAFLSHFFIFLRAFIHQKLFSIQGLYVFIKILQQKKTDGEKWAHNNFANRLAQEWALSPGVCPMHCYVWPSMTMYDPNINMYDYIWQCMPNAYVCIYMPLYDHMYRTI